MCCVEIDGLYFFELRLVIVIEDTAFSTIHDPVEAWSQGINGPNGNLNVELKGPIWSRIGNNKW